MTQLITKHELEAADFILIQVNEEDEFYELARIRPYTIDTKNGWKFDKKLGYYCEGMAQHNGEIGEFSLYLGLKAEDVKYKFINLGYPVEKYNEKYNGEKIRVMD